MTIFSQNDKGILQWYYIGGLSDKLRGITVLSLFILLLGAKVSMAVPACPGGAKVTQPDGTEITIYLRGDEYAHWNESEDGFQIVKSEESGEWVYIQEEAGAAVAGRHVVGKADPKAIGALRPNKEKLSAQAERSRTEKSMVVEPSAFALTTGTMYNLVVLVNFSDLTVAYPRQSYDDLFNQVGYTADGAVGSVKDYYHEISYNALTVQSTVVEAVTLDHGYAYYGANDAYGNDVRPREMVQEALAKLEARGFDFSTVDGDDDGWVDGLTIIHAGGGEEYSGNDTNYIWSHQWALINPVTYDGVSMQTYHTEPARRGWDAYPSTQGITRIGVICHETGHFLDLPDLYDYGYDSEGAGNFCLMAGGSWNGNYGTTPAHMSAWCKSSVGWVSPTLISSGGVYSLGQVETNAQVYKLQGGFPSTQYFLVENRQGVGFDAGLPGSLRGVLIWHIDETRTNNDDQTHYMVDLEEASGTQHLELNLNAGDDADYFRTGNATVFSESSTPNNLSYAGQMLGLNITNVGATGASIPVTITTAPPLPWSDGFESGNLTAGGWTVAGSPSVTPTAKYTGTYGAQIPGSTGSNSITKSKSTEGYNTIHFKYDRKVTRTSLTLVVDWSANGGSSWTTLETTTSTSWASKDWALGTTANNNPNFRIRFRTTAGLNTRYAYIDNVQITGTVSQYTISGTVTSGGTGLDGVAMSGLPGDPCTNSSGNYSATVNYGWSGIVTPTKYAYGFEPNSRSYANVIADQNGQNYTGKLLTFVISGYIKNECNVPIEGVLVDANNDGGEDTTDVNGFYEVWVDYNWSGTVTPTKQNYTFEPNQTSYVNVLADQFDQNSIASNIYDLDCDGSIGFGDLRIISENWLDGPELPGDFYKDEDDIVNFLDFAEFAKHWLEGPIL